MSRLYLVDATYELFRAYTAIPTIRAPDGREVAAVYGLVNTLLRLLREAEASARGDAAPGGPVAPPVVHAACATDCTVESFRNALFAGYKTGDGVPADLLAQFPLAEEAIRALGLVVWPMKEFEADDALATAAARFAGDFEQVVICTPDKDLAQCVRGEQVVALDRRREKLYDAAGVEEKFGVRPEAIPDYLALVGDAADGLPGVPGWGPKSSAALLGAYGVLEAIPNDAAAWSVKVRGASRLAASLAAHREAALLYKRLATLRTDVPLEETPDDLAWRGVPTGPFRSFCAGLGFERLADRPHRWAE